MQREVLEPLLKIQDLRVGLKTRDTEWSGLNGIDLVVAPGEAVGVVGESGSGKTLLALSILRLLEGQRFTLQGKAADLVVSGVVEFCGQNLYLLDQERLRQVRGKGISLIFQESLSSLNPVLRIGVQVAEAFRAHDCVSVKAARNEGLRLLEQVGFSNSKEIAESYPHQLSGGMRQRVCIAMAIACKPKIIIADEPTTALDSTTQSHILNLLDDLRSKEKMSVILISHDLRVVSALCDRIAVMRAGKIVESATKSEFFHSPASAYSKGLIEAIPLPAFTSQELPSQRETLALERVSLSYQKRRGFPSWGSWLKKRRTEISAVSDVSLRLYDGEVFGLLGESGCGKTSLGRCILRIAPRATGSIRLEGNEISGLSFRGMIPFRKRLQLIFQDPGAALNPRMTVREILDEPFLIHSLVPSREARSAAILKCLKDVELGEEVLTLTPQQLSGGQKQRICIARALALKPKVLVCDEPFTALDTPLQAQMVGLLQRIQRERQMTILMISHDLNLVGVFAHRIGVMFGGKIVEVGSPSDLLNAPCHPYSKILVEMRLGLNSEKIPKWSEPPPPEYSASDGACIFYSRCQLRQEKCSKESPLLLPVSPTSPAREVACFFPLVK